MKQQAADNYLDVHEPHDALTSGDNIDHGLVLVEQGAGINLVRPCPSQVGHDIFGTLYRLQGT